MGSLVLHNVLILMLDMNLVIVIVLSCGVVIDENHSLDTREGRKDCHFDSSLVRLDEVSDAIGDLVKSGKGRCKLEGGRAGCGRL